MASEPAIPRSIGKQVAAGAEDDEESYTVEAPATLRDPAVRIYTGAQLDLQLRLYIVRESGQRDPWVQLEGKEYLDGDDDLYTWPTSEIAIEDGEKIMIQADNNDGTNPYDYRVTWTEDREGGASRFLAGLRSLIPGVS